MSNETIISPSRFERLINIPQILAIEDEVQQLDLYEAFLDAYVCKCFRAQSVEEGKHVCRATPINVVLLDMRFPNEPSGAEFLRWRWQNKSRLRVCILTNFMQSDELEEALAYGGFYVAAKPYTKEQLEAVLLDSGVILHPRKVHAAP